MPRIEYCPQCGELLSQKATIGDLPRDPKKVRVVCKEHGEIFVDMDP